MSFAVSMDGGDLEYAGTDLGGLFAQREISCGRASGRCCRICIGSTAMLLAVSPGLSPTVTLGEYLDAHGYGEAFQQDHLLPMAAAIWSASAASVRDYPALHFIRFCDNHGLLKFTGRPLWRTVDGGSRGYVKQVAGTDQRDATGTRARSVRRKSGSVSVRDTSGNEQVFDHVVLACHADQALALLDDPTQDERTLLGAFGYTRNRAVLHRDTSLMPRRRSVWASWNYLGRRKRPDELVVTYWMNRLQGLTGAPPLFLTLNPTDRARERNGALEEVYHHPRFDADAMRSQSGLWSLQGQQRTWFCGAYFGAGFHEDGLQSGLAVAEQLGSVRRPWSVPNESGRITITPTHMPELVS